MIRIKFSITLFIYFNKTIEMNLLLYIYIYIYFGGIKIKDKSLEGVSLREYIQTGLGIKPHLNSQQCFNEDLILLIFFFFKIISVLVHKNIFNKINTHILISLLIANLIKLASNS